MKNIISFVFVFALIWSSHLFYDKRLSLFDYFLKGECEFIIEKSSNNFFLQDMLVVENGNYLHVKMPSSLSKFAFNTLSGVKGITFYTNQSLKEITLQLNVKVFKGANMQEANHYFGFCPKFSNFVFVGGKKVNLHFVKIENMLIVGHPIILGSY